MEQKERKKGVGVGGHMRGSEARKLKIETKDPIKRPRSKEEHKKVKVQGVLRHVHLFILHPLV